MADVLMIAEVAERLRCNPRVIRRMIREGQIPAVRSGRVVRIPARALDRVLGTDDYTPGEDR